MKYFQALQCLSKLLDDLAKPDPLSAALAVTSTKHILINTEGRVHRNTFLQHRNNNARQKIISENKVSDWLWVLVRSDKTRVGKVLYSLFTAGGVLCCHFQLSYIAFISFDSSLQSLDLFNVHHTEIKLIWRVGTHTDPVTVQIYSQIATSTKHLKLHCNNN